MKLKCLSPEHSPFSSHRSPPPSYYLNLAISHIHHHHCLAPKAPSSAPAGEERTARCVPGSYVTLHNPSHLWPQFLLLCKDRTVVGGLGGLVSASQPLTVPPSPSTRALLWGWGWVDGVLLSEFSTYCIFKEFGIYGAFLLWEIVNSSDFLQLFCIVNPLPHPPMQSQSPDMELV